MCRIPGLCPRWNLFMSCPEGGDLTAISPGRRVVSSIRIAPLSAMKGSPDLIPAAELDPRRVCKGKGVVTLRATLVHIDDDDRVSRDPGGHAPPGGWTEQINGDIAEAGLAEGGSHITADLPSVNHTHWLVPVSAHRVNENQAPVSAGVQSRITAPRGSVYPSTTTTTISPDIVLLQQNREQQKHLSPSEDLPLERHPSPEPGRDFPASPCDPVSSDMDGKRMRLSLHSPVTSPLRQPVAPVRNTDKSKDWYKSMFKQIHRIPETPEENPYRPTYIFPESYDRLVVRSKDDGLSPLGYLEEVKGVPRSKSDAEFDSRGRLMPVPTRSSSLKPTTKRNEGGQVTEDRLWPTTALIRNRLTTSPMPLPRSSQRSVSPEVHAISSEWISLTVGGGGGGGGRGSPPAAPTPPLPPLPSVSYRWGEYLPPSLSASPVPPAPYSYAGLGGAGTGGGGGGGGGGSPYCGSPAVSPSASPLPPPYPPRPSSATPFLTFTPPQGEDFLLFPPSSPRGMMSPYGAAAGPGAEGWPRGGREGAERDRREGDGARDAPGSWADPPAEPLKSEIDYQGRTSRSPVMLFDIQDNNNANSFAQPPHSHSGSPEPGRLSCGIFQALYTYAPQNEDELELREGDLVSVMEKCDDGWFVGTSKRTKQFGTFPGNYVKEVNL
ncbi:unnamed protein product [Arctogadus glacialis]